MFRILAAMKRAPVRWSPLRALAILLAAGILSPASARDWKPTTKSKAMEYAEIHDYRSDGDFVFIYWIVPQVADNPDTRQLLDKYALIAVVHAHFSVDGTATFDAVDTLHASDVEGNPLELLHESGMPPAVAGAIATVKSVVRGAAGAMGKGMHLFAFKGGAVRACSKGRLSAQFAGETYTWDTPIPGCPQA